MLESDAYVGGDPIRGRRSSGISGSASIPSEFMFPEAPARPQSLKEFGPSMDSPRRLASPSTPVGTKAISREMLASRMCDSQPWTTNNFRMPPSVLRAPEIRYLQPVRLPNIPDSSPQTGVIITLNSSPSGWFSDTNRGRAETMLHELVHAFEIIYGRIGSPFEDETKATTAAETRAMSGRNHKKVVDGCFK